MKFIVPQPKRLLTKAGIGVWRVVPYKTLLDMAEPSGDYSCVMVPVKFKKLKSETFTINVAKGTCIIENFSKPPRRTKRHRRDKRSPRKKA